MKGEENLGETADVGGIPDLKAMVMYGRAYREGRGVDKDLNKAIKLTRQSYQGGASDAGNELFRMLWELNTPKYSRELKAITTSAGFRYSMLREIMDKKDYEAIQRLVDNGFYYFISDHISDYHICKNEFLLEALSKSLVSEYSERDVKIKSSTAKLINSCLHSRTDSEKRVFFKKLPPAPNLQKRQLQLYLTGMLCDLDSICKEAGINYWLFAGTLLGAVRHEGFIPWDDDMDIAMFQDDIDRLIVVLSSNPKFKLFRITCSPYSHERIPIVYYQFGFKDPNNPFRFDVFPIIKTYSSVDTDKIIDWYLDEVNGGLCNQDILYAELINRFQMGDPLDYAVRINLWGNITLFPISNILPVKRLNFEGNSFPIPNNDEFFLKWYRDYLSLPEKNHSHDKLLTSRYSFLSTIHKE